MLTGITDLLPQRADVAFERQRARRHPPPATRRAEDQIRIGARVVEEHSVERAESPVSATIGRISTPDQPCNQSPETSRMPRDHLCRLEAEVL